MYNTTPSFLIDKLIQYDYKTLHTRYIDIASRKTNGRKLGDIQNPNLKTKVNFKYKRLEVEQIPLIWAKIWDLLTLKGHKCKVTHHHHSDNFINNTEHILKTLEEFSFHNVIDKLLGYIETESNRNINLYELNQLHKILLSIT